VTTLKVGREGRREERREETYLECLLRFVFPFTGREDRLGFH